MAIAVRLGLKRFLAFKSDIRHFYRDVGECYSEAHIRAKASAGRR